MCATQRLVLKRGNTTLFVSGGRIFVDRLVMASVVILKIVDEVDGLFKDLLIHATVHQDRLRSKHLGNLC